MLTKFVVVIDHFVYAFEEACLEMVFDLFQCVYVNIRRAVDVEEEFWE